MCMYDRHACQESSLHARAAELRITQTAVPALLVATLASEREVGLGGGVGDKSRGVKPVEVNRPEDETVRPQRSIQPPVGCSSADPLRSVTVVSNDRSLVLRYH